MKNSNVFNRFLSVAIIVFLVSLLLLFSYLSGQKSAVTVTVEQPKEEAKEVKYVVFKDDTLKELDYLKNIREYIDVLDKENKNLGVKITHLIKFDGELNPEAIGSTKNTIKKLKEASENLLNTPIHDPHYDLMRLVEFSLTDLKSIEDCLLMNFDSEERVEDIHKEKLIKNYDVYKSKISAVIENYNTNLEVIRNG